MNLRIATAFILLVYSLILLSLEFQHGQEYVRPYFTDLHGSVFLYGINTSFTAFLLLACALLFFISSSLLNSPIQKWFCYSQMVLFLLFLGKFFSMPRKIQALLLIAAGLFGLMVYVDVRGAEDGFLRLSVEDLLKSWSVFFLFLYSYTYMQIYALKPLKND